MIVNTNDNVIQMQSKKRKKEGQSPKKQKAQKASKETDAENVDSTNVPFSTLEPIQELQD